MVARPEQRTPVDEFFIWLLLGGRGSGKTRTGAEWVREGIEDGSCRRVALVAPTWGDGRNLMIEGDSGLLSLSWSEGWEPIYEKTKLKLTFPNGAWARVYTAEKPARLRGKQHDRGWCDELASWQYLEETWDMLMFGLRLGLNPQIAVTTTPKPRKKVKELVLNSKAEGSDTVMTHMTTYDNLANLSPKFRKRIIEKYEGTRLGKRSAGGAGEAGRHFVFLD